MATKTLLVLGAGASYGYGVPLGHALAKMVSKRITSIGLRPHGRGGDDELHRQQHTDDAAAIEKGIVVSGAPTIDIFLKHRNDIRKQALAAVADVLWDREDHALTQLRNSMVYRDRAEPVFSDDWLHWLYWTYYQGEVDQSITIASYNYERLPVAMLASRRSFHRHEDPERALSLVDQSLATIHIHGSLGTEKVGRNGNYASLVRDRDLDRPPGPAVIRSHYPSDWHNNEKSRLIRDEAVHLLADGLSIVSDGDRQQQIDEMLWPTFEAADRVVFLGIGYHPEMLQDFCFHDKPAHEWFSKKEFVGGTAYQLDELVRKRVNRWGGQAFEIGGKAETCTQFLSRTLLPY